MASLTVMHNEAAWEACTTAGYSNVFGEKTRMTSSFFSLAPLRKPCASRLLKLRSSPNLSKKDVGARPYRFHPTHFTVLSVRPSI